jgi:hypothetical protein
VKIGDNYVLYNGLQDAQNVGDILENDVRQKMILPLSFQGGERAMGQLYQNAMARVRKFGKPDLFITFTCNPKWKKITDTLLSGQTTKDRPELVTRVFNLKLDALLKDIKDGVLGNVIVKVWVIEFLKRGLPHTHILLILDEVSKLRIVEDYNSMVSAHINMEICSSIYVVKYLYKYVYKGPNRATVVVERWVDTPSQENNPQAVIANAEWQNRDEIKAYLEGCYVFASEASWRLFSFRMHDKTLFVTRRAVHEPGMHTVVYNDNANIFETVNSE